jgi:hypothetical protein
VNDDERGPAPGGSGHASFHGGPSRRARSGAGTDRCAPPKGAGPSAESGRVPAEHGPVGTGGVGAERTGASGRAPVERVLTQDSVATVRGGPAPAVRPP